MSESLRIEVVYASPSAQKLVSVELPADATVATAIAASGLIDVFPHDGLPELPVGIWGRPTNAAQRLQDGDRVEIYRPLVIDPMTARRLRASAPGPDPDESR